MDGGVEAGTEAERDAGRDASVGNAGDAEPGDAGGEVRHLVLTEDDILGIEKSGCGAFELDRPPLGACNVQLPEPPPGEMLDPDLFNVVISFTDGEAWLLLPGSSDDCVEGWYLVGETEVALCPQSCEQYHADEGARLQLVLGCKGVVIGTP